MDIQKSGYGMNLGPEHGQNFDRLEYREEKVKMEGKCKYVCLANK